MKSSLILILLVVSGCAEQSVNDCRIEAGTIAADPLASSAPAILCAWSGRSDGLTLIIGTNGLKLAMQLHGNSINGTWTFIPWSGKSPSFMDDRDDANTIDQELSGGKAALYAHVGADDAPSAGGGSVSLSGEPLPNAVGSYSSIGVELAHVQLASTASAANPFIDGNIQLYVGIAQVQ